MARGAGNWGYDCAMVGQTMRRRGSLRARALSRVRSPSSPADAAPDRRRHFGLRGNQRELTLPRCQEAMLMRIDTPSGSTSGDGCGSNHSEHRIHQLSGSGPHRTQNSDANPGGRPKHYLRGRSRPNGPCKSGLIHLELMFEKRSIVSLLFNQAEDDPRQLGGDRRVAFATEVGIKRIGSNIVVELATETVLAHSHRALRGHPQSSTQPGVAILGDVALTTGFTRLQSRKVQSAELQELAMIVLRKNLGRDLKREK
jgi:hypothetical protein